VHYDTESIMPAHGWLSIPGWGQCFQFPLVLWHCWSGVQPVKINYRQRFSLRTGGQKKQQGNQLTQVQL